MPTQRHWYLANRGRLIEYSRKWALEHPDKVKTNQQKHYAKYKNTIVARAKRWHATPYGRARSLFRLAKTRAEKKGIPFTIEFDDILERISNGYCEITGLPFDLSNGNGYMKRNPYAPSIDRIDSGGGYTTKNVRVVCLAINYALATWGLDAFVPFAEAIIASQRKKAAA